MATIYSITQYLLFIVIVTILVKPLGGYLERVFSGKRTAIDRFLIPLEKLIHRVTRVDARAEMTFSQYATCFILFGLFGTLLLYSVLRIQRVLPWFFPSYHTTPVTPNLALNTAVSFRRLQHGRPTRVRTH